MKTKVFIILFTLGMLSICNCQNLTKPTSVVKDIIAENDSVAILSQVIDSAKDEYDIPEVAIWIKIRPPGRSQNFIRPCVLTGFAGILVTEINSARFQLTQFLLRVK